MLSDEPPVFIPGKFTAWGKWMDGWETRRKRQAGHDWCERDSFALSLCLTSSPFSPLLPSSPSRCVLKLARPAHLLGFELDTAFFTGNQTPVFSVQAACLSEVDPLCSQLQALRAQHLAFNAGGGFAASAEELKLVEGLDSGSWTELVPRRRLRPGYEQTRLHSFEVPRDLRAPSAGAGWTHLRVNMYPDGGIARLRARGVVCLEPDRLVASDVAWGKASTACLLDLAAALHGGVALGASNAHYGRCSNLSAPGRARNMGEGWETARNPNRPQVLEVDAQGNIVMPPEHVDWAVLRLGCPGTVTRLEIDTNHFKGNCPESCLVEGGLFEMPEDVDLAVEMKAVAGEQAAWGVLLPRTRLVPHSRHFFEVPAFRASHVRIKIYPDGGISRLRVYGDKLQA
jgi:allantoicase